MKMGVSKSFLSRVLILVSIVFMAGCSSDEYENLGTTMRVMAGPQGWVYDPDHKSVTPYEDGSASEKDDLFRMTEKNKDGKYYTDSAIRAANRIFKYGSYHKKDRDDVVSYFPIAPSHSDEEHIYYVMRASVTEYTFRIYSKNKSAYMDDISCKTFKDSDSRNRK